TDSFNLSNQTIQEEVERPYPEEEKPWWHWQNITKQVSLTALNIGASVAGGAGGAALGAKIGAVFGTAIPIPVVGTLSGAAIGGAIGWFVGSFLAGAATSSASQKLTEGKIDGGQALIDGLTGAIPIPGLGPLVAKTLGKLGIGVLKEGLETATSKIITGVVEGASEGSVQGSIQGAATSVYQQGKNGGFNGLRLAQDTFSGFAGGLIGGGFMGGSISLANTKFQRGTAAPSSTSMTFLESDLNEDEVYAAFTGSTQDPVSLLSKMFLRSIYKGDLNSKTHAVAIYYDRLDQQWKAFTMSPFGSGERLLDSWLTTHKRLNSKVSLQTIGKTNEHLDWDKVKEFRTHKPLYSFVKLAQLGLVEAFPSFMPWLRKASRDLEPNDFICTEGVLAVLKSDSPLVRSIEEKELKNFLLLPDQLEEIIQKQN
ncbi:MAG: hypothetical protein SFU25_06205, partial [Candidatus Caenarcaniphilales bacterium]|nr:hypothetical protein [Candidatus Caenarcaniphilales bacterium]